MRSDAALGRPRTRGRAATSLAVVLATACASRPRSPDAPPRWREGECLARITLAHDASPLAELHELGGWRGDVQARFPAATIDPATQHPVTAAARLRLDGQPIAWLSSTLDAVVLDGAAFAPLRRADATSGPPAPDAPPPTSAPAERQVVGRVFPRARRALGDRGVLELLLRVEVIQTYWQGGSELCVVGEQARDGAYRAELRGVHHTVVSRGTLVPRGVLGPRPREVHFAFAVEIDREGEISVLTLPTPAS